jgi:hypothetical protein
VISDHARPTLEPKRQPVAASKRAAVGGTARCMQTALATAIKEYPDWKEFQG